MENRQNGDSLSFEEYLNRYGTLVYTNTGVSMLPLIRQGKDVMVIRKRPETLKKYDAVLYHIGGRYVLHRIIRVMPGRYNIRGDNCITTENDIPDGAVIGVLEAVLRGGGSGRTIRADDIGYRIYSRYVVWRYPIWRIFKAMRSRAVRLWRKLTHSERER